jgi:uncharacterized protein YceK
MKKLLAAIMAMLLLAGCSQFSSKEIAGYGAGRNFTSRDSDSW